MGKKESNSNELRMKEVKLMIGQIDEILKKNYEIEEYEECAKLRDAKLNLQQHINGDKDYEEIKEELSSVKQKFSSILPDALKSNRKNP